ncbi:MAG TPA: hypothetical protein PKL96_11730 [Bacteroidales bacterium]|nr:hypothetical protein [Bacteroidales bacterium]HPS27923.1 hypothetical protein [Bacteroidales bacterium]
MDNAGENKPKTTKYKVIIGIESVIILALLALLITSRSKVNTFIIEKDKAVTERNVLQNELDSLLTEHEKIRTEYGNLTADLGLKDSTIQAQAEEIQKLIESNAGKRQIQRKLDYLRGITQDYVAQIDKLLKENENLKTEVKGMQENIKEVQNKSLLLEKDKEVLTEKINSAAVLQANTLTAYGIRFRQGGKKEEAEDKAKRVEKIKISFTLSRNPLVEEGLKTVYIRIARPDQAILNEGSSFEYEGKQIMYSLQEQVYYKGSPIPVNMYYEKSDRIVPGTYHIAVFTDGKEIGQTQLTLK